MREQSCIFFDDSFTVHKSVMVIENSNCSIIEVVKTTYKARFVVGEEANYTKDVHEHIKGLFLKICESYNIPTDTPAFDIGAIKRKAKTENVYRFFLTVFNDELNKLIQDAIVDQVNIDHAGKDKEFSFIDRCLTRCLEGRSFDDDFNNTKVLSKFQDTTPEDVICVIHLFNTAEKDLNKILKAIGKLYMDSECMRVNKNKYICHDYIIEGSTACHIIIDRSSEDQNFEHESGNGIEIRLPDNIESGFVRYLRELTRIDGLSTIIDQTIRVIDNISDSIKDVPKSVPSKSIKWEGRK